MQMRQLRKDLLVVAEAPGLAPTAGSKFRAMTNDGTLVTEHKLEKQECQPGSKREFVRSPNPNDLFFAYICDDQIGFYRFEMRDVKESKSKALVIAELWVTNLDKLGLAMPIKSATFTRSMSSKLKVIVATGEKVAVLAQKDGALESMSQFEDDGLAAN